MMEPGNGTGGGLRRKAQRVQLACEPCRIGKLKCDRKLPVCDQCYKRSRESVCKYTDRGFRYNSARANAESIREKIDRLETFVNRIREEPNDETLASPGAVPHINRVNGEEAAHIERDLIPLTGKLDLSEKGTRYVGGSHWESIIDDIADVKAYFDLESMSPAFDESIDDGTSLPSAETSPSNPLLGVGQSISKLELLQLMPQKVEMDRLVAAWFNASDPLRLIVHAVTFQKQYQDFWHNPEEVSPAWLSLLYAVGAIGAQASGQARRDAKTLALAEDLRRLTTHALVLANAFYPQPYIIEALMFYEKSLLLKSHDTLPQAWQVHGQILRLCFHAGYHRDPGNNSKISPFECEMRRRVWLMVVEYDVLSSYQLGLASLINWKLCDTASPSNLLDHDFSEDSVPPSRPLEDYTLMLAGIRHGRLVEIFGSIVVTSQTIQAASRADIQALRERVDLARDTLPHALRMLPMDQCFMDPPGQLLDRYRLEHLYYKALCVLYRRFVGQPGYKEEHKQCLLAAENLVTCQVPLLEAIQPGAQLSSCLVFVFRHIHDFNLAAILLCSEIKRLSTNPPDKEDNGLIARVRPIMLQLCSLWIASGVVSPKARQAVRAVQRFLLQTLSTPPADMQNSSNVIAQIPGPGPVTQPSTSVAKAVQPPMKDAALPFLAGHDLTAAFSGADGDLVDMLEIEQDPLFHDIFGDVSNGDGGGDVGNAEAYAQFQWGLV